MIDYRELYYQMAADMAQAIELLIVAQQKAEETVLAEEDGLELHLSQKPDIVAEDN